MEPKVHYGVHNDPPLVPILSQTNPVHTFPADFSEIYSDIIFSHLLPGLPKSLFPSEFPARIYTGGETFRKTSTSKTKKQTAAKRIDGF
jgi:hypothetical protein